MKTVFITGASSGIGKATAHYFQKKGWNVVATMRTPSREKSLNQLNNVTILPLDVEDQTSIERAISDAVERFGRIEVLVNNAGYAVTGPFEATTAEQREKQFNVNVFGLMRVTKALLPLFRAQQEGVIINISSLGGRVTIPLYSLYFSTKWAIEGFTESLAYELSPFNIRVKLIEPGATKTDFTSRGQVIANTSSVPAYAPYVEKIRQRTSSAATKNLSPSEVVAKTIYRAATDGSHKLRYPCAGKAKLILWIRRLLGYRLYTRIVRRVMG